MFIVVFYMCMLMLILKFNDKEIVIQSVNIRIETLNNFQYIDKLVNFAIVIGYMLYFMMMYTI